MWKIDTKFQTRVIKGDGENHESYFVNWLERKLKDGSIKLNFKFYDEGYVIDKIKESDIEHWSCRQPIIISAPTGSGKNRLIKQTLLQYALNHQRNGKKDRILILSNRIALNRQSKYKFAQKVVEYTGDYACLERLEELYTAEGSDRLCFDFGPVTICSYHQLLERQLLDKRHFTYVVCDECHFFTNDATFNPNTDIILKYIIEKCQSSIRIYMSATIDTVIEPIIREEFKYTEEAIKMEEDACRKYCNDPIHRMNMRMGNNLPYFMNIDSITETRANMLLNQFKKDHCFTINLYYMHRTYSQINNIYQFSSMNEMTNIILKDKDNSHKWLCFVSDIKTGERMMADINRQGSKHATFISRKSVDESEVIKKVYDDLIANEYFRDDVIISTSILDNGINIKKCPNGDRITGVMIDSFNKDQFIQMLGRVRTDKNEQFDLYVRKLDIDEIKSKFVRILDDLAKRLRIDFMDIDKRKKIYDANTNMFHFTTDEEGFCSYNQLAIVQLCNLALPMIQYIRSNHVNDPISCSTMELDSYRVKAIQYYKYDAGISNPYADLIVCVLEGNMPSSNYKSFQSFLETELIYPYCENKILDKIESYKNLDKDVKAEFEWREAEDWLFASESAIDKLYELTTLLKAKGFHIETPEEDRYSGLGEFYFNKDCFRITENIEASSRDIQSSWLNHKNFMCWPNID